MLGIILPILFTYYVYKNAKENGRKAWAWALLNIAVILVVQIGFGIAAGIFLMIATQSTDFADEMNSGWWILLNIVGTILSFAASYFVYRHVTRIPDSAFVQPPPPPPMFN